MKHQNIVLMSVAAVIVILCLLASWVYLGDDGNGGSEDPSEMRDAAVGDWREMEYTVTEPGSDPVTYTCVETVVSIVGDVITVEYAYEDGSVETVETTGGLTSDEEDGFAYIGTERISAGELGDFVCEVYELVIEGPDGMTVTYWVDRDSGLIIKSHAAYGDGYETDALLVGTSMFGPAPTYGSQEVSLDPRAGDYFYIAITGEDGEAETTILDAFVVGSVDGDTYTFGWASEDRMYTGTVQDFINTYYYGDYAEEDVVGQALLRTGWYGDIVCDMLVFEHEGYVQTLYVGASDGVIYRDVAEYDDGWVETMDTLFGTLIGDGMDMPGFSNDVGDHLTKVEYADDGSSYEWTMTIAGFDGEQYTIDYSDSEGEAYTFTSDYGLIYDGGYFSGTVESMGSMEVLDFGEMMYVIVERDEPSEGYTAYDTFVLGIDMVIGTLYENYDGTSSYSEVVDTSVLD